jgi:predicted enzyme related to lactoylglutathione lyase
MTEAKDPVPSFAGLSDGTPTLLEIGAPSAHVSAEFFGSLFGWRVHAMGKDGHWAQTAGPVIGMHHGDEDRNMVPYFAVKDIAAAVARVRELGGEAPDPGEEHPGFGRFAECKDPQGVRFGVHQRPGT